MAKKPQDYKRKREPFTFLIGGVEHSLRPPKFKEMVTANTVEDNFDGMLALLGACAESDTTLDAINELEMPDVNDLFTDWLAEMGGGEGKSSGSST